MYGHKSLFIAPLSKMLLGVFIFYYLFIYQNRLIFTFHQGYQMRLPKPLQFTTNLLPATGLKTSPATPYPNLSLIKN